MSVCVGKGRRETVRQVVRDVVWGNQEGDKHPEMGSGRGCQTGCDD